MTLLARMLALIIIISALINLPRDLEFGPITVVGLLTILYAAASWLLLSAYLMIPRAASAMGWFVLFLLWGFSSFIWNPPIPGGIQNLMVYSAFAGLLLLSATESYRAPYLSRYLGISFAWASRLALALYVLGITAGVPRSFALFSLLGVAWFLAEWRYGSRSGLWWAIAITLMIGVSLSRMALFVALLMFPLSRLRLRSIGGLMNVSLWIALTVVTCYVLLTYVEPLNAKFFNHTGEKALRIGGIAINSSGRTTFWPAVLASFWESPWIGKGAGSSLEVVAAVHPGVRQPHNDYLRILHDYGLVGMALWLLGFCGLLWTTWRAWLRADSFRKAEAQIHLAAFLTLVALVLTMFTDNVSIYTYVIAPAAVLVGTSLGNLSRSRIQAQSFLLSTEMSRG